MRMILVAVLACVATTAFPVGQSGAEKIVFDFCYADQYAWEIACEIGLSDPDGSNTIWLTGGAFPGAKQPPPTPDGSRVAFVHGGYAVADHIFVLNIAQGSLDRKSV